MTAASTLASTWNAGPGSGAPGVWEAEGGAPGSGAPSTSSAPSTAEQRSIEMMGAMLTLYCDMPGDLRLRLFSDLYGSLIAPAP